MARFKLPSGYAVTTAKLPAKRTEFTTTNPEGDVISTVELGRAAARDMLLDVIAIGRRCNR
jgi:hypothetical protein